VRLIKNELSISEFQVKDFFGSK